jgi:hypothetical protein
VKAHDPAGGGRVRTLWMVTVLNQRVRAGRVRRGTARHRARNCREGGRPQARMLAQGRTSEHWALTHAHARPHFSVKPTRTRACVRLGLTPRRRAR